MAFPWGATLVDDFNRANNANLGANWTTITAFGNPITVETNKARGSAGNFCAEYWNVSQYGPDCAIYDTFNIFGGGQFQYLILRSDGNTNQYELVVTTSTWQIYKRDSGGATPLGSSATQAVSSGDKWGFEVIGSALKGYYFNGSTWNVIVSTNDSTYTAAGFVGIGTESNGSILDDFFAGTIVSANPTDTLVAHYVRSGPF